MPNTHFTYKPGNFIITKNNKIRGYIVESDEKRDDDAYWVCIDDSTYSLNTSEFELDENVYRVVKNV